MRVKAEVVTYCGVVYVELWKERETGFHWDDMMTIGPSTDVASYDAATLMAAHINEQLTEFKLDD